MCPAVCLLLNICSYTTEQFFFNLCVRVSLGNSDFHLYCPRNVNRNSVHYVMEYTACNSLLTI